MRVRRRRRRLSHGSALFPAAHPALVMSYTQRRRGCCAFLKGDQCSSTPPHCLQSSACPSALCGRGWSGGREFRRASQMRMDMRHGQCGSWNRVVWPLGCLLLSPVWFVTADLSREAVGVDTMVARRSRAFRRYGRRRDSVPVPGTARVGIPGGWHRRYYVAKSALARAGRGRGDLTGHALMRGHTAVPVASNPCVPYSEHAEIFSTFFPANSARPVAARKTNQDSLCLASRSRR